MRVLLGLAALAAVNGQTTITPSTNTGVQATSPPPGTTALAAIGLTFPNGAQVATIIPSGFINSNTAGFLTSNNWAITIPNAVTSVVFTFKTNQYTGQMQYRWSPNYTPGAAYTCDPCAGGTTASCGTANGPGTGGSTLVLPCASFTRTYTMSNLQVGNNAFSVQLFDIQTNPFADVSSYSFALSRSTPAIIVGDPQIVGMQGQDFQVHGVPDEIFNIVSYPTLQVNARFTYLESGACHDNFTACFAHPGTYISEEGIRIGKDKVRVSAGSFKKGLTVHVNGKKIKSNTDLKSGAVEMVNHRRVVVHTDVMRVAISNSDFFLNQELELMDDKLVSLGSKRITLKDNEKFHSEVPLHGLQGQTWRNVEYPSGLEYEGSIMDYHVVDGNLFGTDFVFNQFQS